MSGYPTGASVDGAVDTAAFAAFESMLTTPWPPEDTSYARSPVTAEVIEKASSPRFGSWWRRVESVGYCARPIHLAAHTPTGTFTTMARCKNRRASVCPSCSALYASDTWHLVHAGIGGNTRRQIPATVAGHPMVFATLTAPSYGPVHRETTPGEPCRIGRVRRCSHGKPLHCNMSH